MATILPHPEDRSGSRMPGQRPGVSRSGPQHRHRDLVSDTLAALRDGRAKRFSRHAKPTDTARHMLDRLRSR